MGAATVTGHAPHDRAGDALAVAVDGRRVEAPAAIAHEALDAPAGDLGEHRHLDRGRRLAHQALEFFTPSAILYGEGHPQRSLSPKGCRKVDLGYDVEESLPSLGMYAVLTHDTPVLQQVLAAMRTAIEFMLPDGSWDNSWGTRNYKWSWWGSRTTDGCHPGFILLAEHDPRLKEAALRNLELMRSCTHNGLLYGGPHYLAHGDFPCIHHTFTHAKALATVLDRCPQPIPDSRLPLPRDEPYGLRSYPVIDTHLASIGDWRATVTAYDLELSRLAGRADTAASKLAAVRGEVLRHANALEAAGARRDAAAAELARAEAEADAGDGDAALDLTREDRDRVGGLADRDELVVDFDRAGHAAARGAE